MEHPKSLGEILDQLKQLDSDMPPEEFDPAQVIGDLKDKVDAIKWRLDSWETEAEMIQHKWIKPLQERIKSIQGKHEKLRRYIKDQMIAQGFEKLPGNMFTASIRKNPPSLKFTQEPTADMLLDYPSLVDMQQTVAYVYLKDEIKAALKAGQQLPFARLEQGQRVDFVAKKVTE